MSDWQRRESGLIVPAEVAPKKPRMTRDEYMAAHVACPQCFGRDVEQTCVGYLPGDYVEPFQDSNRASCGCGWSGIVHDLVAGVGHTCEPKSMCAKQGENDRGQN
jgi:hypothetical protein